MKEKIKKCPIVGQFLFLDRLFTWRYVGLSEFLKSRERLAAKRSASVGRSDGGTATLPEISTFF
jgi:hypothetical protein